MQHRTNLFIFFSSMFILLSLCLCFCRFQSSYDNNYSTIIKLFVEMIYVQTSHTAMYFTQEQAFWLMNFLVAFSRTIKIFNCIQRIGFNLPALYNNNLHFVKPFQFCLGQHLQLPLEVSYQHPLYRYSILKLPG